jgi:hypothetical protein
MAMSTASERVYPAIVIHNTLNAELPMRTAIIVFMLAATRGPLIAQQPPPTQQTPQQLQQLVAPIALYPDALVAQILTASTYPAEVVEADRWMQQHSDLKGDDLGNAVNGQSWDPSVKALTQFPSVLTNMDKNISWTSSLGDAYVNQQSDVMAAVQVMREQAQRTGKLTSDSQEQVTTQGSTIVIQPTNPDVVYVPAYDPWTIYGDPLPVYPGWVGVPGIFYDGPGFDWGFGVGIGLGVYGGFGWGWHHWDADWHHHDVAFDHRPYVSRSTTFVNRRAVINRTPPVFSHQAARGFAQPRGGTRSGAFSGFGHGGTTRGFSAQGHASFGGGFHGGGGHH